MSSFRNRAKALSKNMLASACVSCATKGDDANDIIFCDGCDSGHCQNCAGLATVGDWFLSFGKSCHPAP